MSYYKPLPNNLTIKPSSIEGLGLFATENIATNVDLGPTHLINKDFEDGVIRLPLGGFFNHSDDSNCRIINGIYSDQLEYPCLRLITIKDIKAGDEITAKYTLYDPSK
jgi:SET domain-containing protein